MSTELQTTQAGPLPATQIRETVATIKARVQMVQHVMADVMKKDVHYGTIPGTPKPTLYKPGAEIIALAFQFAPRYVVDDLSTTESVHYRTTCELYSRDTGAFIGSGQGECSSDEEKYKWRKAVCPAEFDATPEDRRRQKFYKNGGTAPQVRIEPADIANTVLKMGEKRAFIDAIRTTTGCSDMFGQDIEDLPSEVRDGMDGQEQPEAPTPLGVDGWNKLAGEAAGFGYTPEDIVASAATAGYEGPPDQMPRDLGKRLYRSMRDNPVNPPDDPAAADAPEAQDSGAAEPQKTLQDAQREQAAKSPSAMAADLQAKAEAKERGRVITRRDVTWITTQATISGIGDDELYQWIIDEVGVERPEDIPAVRLDDVKAWIESRKVEQAAAQ